MTILPPNHQQQKLTFFYMYAVGLVLTLSHTREHLNSDEGYTHKDLPATNTAEHKLLYLGFYYSMKETRQRSTEELRATNRPGHRACTRLLRHDRQDLLGVAVSCMLARTTRHLPTIHATHTDSSNRLRLNLNGNNLQVRAHTYTNKPVVRDTHMHVHG
jgi:hypothetical protein